MRPFLPTMVLLNAILAGLITAMPAVSRPETPTAGNPGMPAQSSEPAAIAQVAAGPSSPAEATMFGSSGAAASKSIGTPTPAPPPRADDMHLLGVFMAQQGGDRPSVVSLLRHGTPPVVSRLALGGTLDGWRLVSATRTTVTLSGADGATRVLQVGPGAQDRAR